MGITSGVSRLRLSNQLKAAIESHGLPVYLVAEHSGVAHSVLCRFLSDNSRSHRDLYFEKTVEKLAAYFGMEFTKPTRPPVTSKASDTDLPGAAAIGKKIHTARQNAGLEQSAAAELAALSQSVWSRAETGARLPSMKTLQRIAGALGISVRDLMPEVTAHTPGSSEGAG